MFELRCERRSGVYNGWSLVVKEGIEHIGIEGLGKELGSYSRRDKKS